MKFSFNLQSLREEKDLSIRHLSFLSGVSRTQISKIESNEANPQLMTICKLASALETDITKLFTVIEESGDVESA